MKIAVLGYGTVGSGVVEVLEVNRDLITRRAGREIDVKYVLDLRDFPGQKIQEKIIHDYNVILNDPEIEIVVEVMGGVEPANTFVSKALQAQKSVVTSNKALVAKHGSELLATARKNHVNFLFEASVGGGIPILRALGSSLTADEIEEIAGILNGTTNYMMTKMFYEGADYETVLKEVTPSDYLCISGWEVLKGSITKSNNPSESIDYKRGFRPYELFNEMSIELGNLHLL